MGRPYSLTAGRFSRRKVVRLLLSVAVVEFGERRDRRGSAQTLRGTRKIRVSRLIGLFCRRSGVQELEIYLDGHFVADQEPADCKL